MEYKKSILTPEQVENFSKYMRSVGVTLDEAVERLSSKIKRKDEHPQNKLDKK